MYQFHYGVVKQVYGEKSTLNFTDTDSLCYSIETTDLYEDMVSTLDGDHGREWFDFFKYPVSHPCHSNGNKKVIGKMKDELGGAPMIEFVGLRAKLYAFRQRQWRDEKGELSDEVGEVKKCKGIGGAAKKHDLLFAHYRDCLFS